MILFVALFLLPFKANCDPLLDAIKLAERGATLQALRVQVAAENIANASVLPNASSQKPYRRKVLIVKHRKMLLPSFHISKDLKTPFKLKYDPMHRAANKEGYVQCPNVDKTVEAADVAEAKIGYDLNIRLIKLLTEMSRTTIVAIK
jgi:flagellar basal-body rod protein FlgC